MSLRNILADTYLQTAIALAPRKLAPLVGLEQKPRSLLDVARSVVIARQHEAHLREVNKDWLERGAAMD